MQPPHLRRSGVWTYYDASYYAAPDGDAGKDVYAVLREAIKGTGRVALSRVTIGGRERAIALMPMDGGLVAHTLNEERDINDAKPLFEGLDKVKVDPEMVKLATQLIDRQTGEYDPKDVEDRYEARLREVIEAKLKGEGIEPVQEEAPQSNVIDLMSALRKSLEQEGEKAEEKRGDRSNPRRRTFPLSGWSSSRPARSRNPRRP